MPRHVIGRADELPPGSRRIVEIDGRSIGVFNVGGRYYALRNTCPHQGAPLCEGDVVGSLRSSSPGEYDHEPGRSFLACPWHNWEFDLATGRSWFDPTRTRVRAYTVETLRVTVDDDYLVVCS
ncbi:MAG: Rieske 2Fe-2S domain-containing protein [Streptosporangiales bacterium]|nr:Rieske 2Fe-2S domain-containing protein [Streptosporangiales bacterium]